MGEVRERAPGIGPRVSRRENNDPNYPLTILLVFCQIWQISYQNSQFLAELRLETGGGCLDNIRVPKPTSRWKMKSSQHQGEEWNLANLKFRFQKKSGLCWGQCGPKKWNMFIIFSRKHEKHSFFMKMKSARFYLFFWKWNLAKISRKHENIFHFSWKWNTFFNENKMDFIFMKNIFFSKNENYFIFHENEITSYY